MNTTTDRLIVDDKQRAEWDAMLEADADVLAAMDRHEAWLEAQADLAAEQAAAAREGLS